MTDDQPRYGVRWWPAEHPDAAFVTPCYDEAEAHFYAHAIPGQGVFPGPFCREVVTLTPGGWEATS